MTVVALFDRNRFVIENIPAYVTPRRERPRIRDGKAMVLRRPHIHSNKYELSLIVGTTCNKQVSVAVELEYFHVLTISALLSISSSSLP